MILTPGPSLDPRNKYQRYNSTDAGKKRMKKYRHDNSKWQTDAHYLARPIASIDGEGITRDDGSHDYIMLGISDVPPIIDPDGLSQLEIFRYIWTNMSSTALNVIYGGSYDFNMWLKGLERDKLDKLYRSHALSKPVEVLEGWWVKWVDGKQFVLEHNRRRIVIWDIVPFFQCPFVDACDQYLADFQPWIDGRAEVVREKARRGNFTVEDVATVDHYNQLELVLLKELATELRSRMNRVGLRPRRWDGPGAIAAALFAREGVKQHLDRNIPEPVAKAARYAYAGGRFELLKYGSVRENVYEYDINSAYPAALVQVPSLQNGEWIRRSGDPGDLSFALYKVESYTPDKYGPGPVFVRTPTGRIYYPQRATNWVWSPEMEALRLYVESVPGATFRILDCWEFRPGFGTDKPFAFLGKMYERRRELKAAGDGAEKALKLGYNSGYGKAAQQTGYIPGANLHLPEDHPDYRPPRIPPYHQLEWAGWVTSWCRSRVFMAAMQNPNAIIAFETDALFSSEPLDLDTGEGLGQWEVTTFTSLTYVQSGHYYGTKLGKKGPEEVVRCRGIDRGSITREDVERTLQKPETARVLEARLTRFYRAGVALMQGMQKWCRWEVTPKTLSLFPTGKRVHIRCPECVDEHGYHEGLRLGVWHRTRCPIREGVSSEFPVKWINPDPNMSELEEARGQVPDYEIG